MEDVERLIKPAMKKNIITNTNSFDNYIKFIASVDVDDIKEGKKVQDKKYISVLCNAVNNTADINKFDGIIGDNTGDNISNKYEEYGDLTVLFWAWKNIRANFIGFGCSGRKLKLQKFNDYNNKTIIKAKSCKLNNAYKNLYYFWSDSFSLDVDFLTNALEVIHDKYPYLYKTAKKIIYKSHYYSDKLLFLMARNEFDEFCQFLFDVIDNVINRLDEKHSSKAQRRIVNLLGCILLDIFCQYKQLNGYEIIYKEDEGAYLTEESIELKPAFSFNNNAIVFACSNTYAPYLGVTIESLKDNISTDQNYDIIVLERNISKLNMKKLKSIVVDYSNISLRFFNVEAIVSDIDFYLPNNNLDLSEETYYTVLAPWVLKNYDKAAVLDCDIIIDHDISELYRVNLNDNYLAATIEYLFQAFLNNKKVNKNGRVSKYCRETLGLDDEFEYFQAGVLLMNLKLFRKDFIMKDLLEDIDHNKYDIVEQDLLNKIAKGRWLKLDYRWNYMACYSDTVVAHLDFIPDNERKEYDSLKGRAYIYHYITGDKPWRNPSLKYADIWWKYAAKTVYYEESVKEMISFVSNNVFSNFAKSAGDYRRVSGKVIDRLFPRGTKFRTLVGRTFPVHSIGRNIIDHFYLKKKYRL